MDCLKVPEAGLLLQGPSVHDTPLPPQAFALSLSGSVVDGLLRAARDGSSIQLALGKNPTLHYGNNSHRISRPDSSSPYDLYLTRPYDSTRVAARLPITTNLFTKLTKSKTKQKTASFNKGADSGLDSDIDALQNGLTARETAKERIQTTERIPSTSKSSKTKSKLLSGYNAVPRSIATSPNHSPSPATAPAPSAAKQAVERAKEQRVALVHELATGEKSTEYLQQKWTGRPEDFKSALDKTAVYDPDTKYWSMTKHYWKELDVWNYDYEGQDERQIAIENAIKQYDKQRLSASEPEWQRLLKKEERGKGKCLSRLQASLVNGPTQPAPKIKVQKADGSSTSKDDGDNHSLASDRSRAGGESMSRTNSAGSVTKPKKPAKEPEPKRPPPTTKSKPAMPKPSPTKLKAAGAKSNGGRVLSQAIIENSDSSGDEAPLAQSKPKPKPKPPVSKEPPPRPLSKPAAKSAAKPAAKPAPVKRPHYEEDESSSSSGTPLSKRLKQKPTQQTGSKLKDRVPDLHNSSRPAAKTTSTKPKNTSPIKSSPLATSPPTNASDIESDHRRPVKKRKAEMDSRVEAAKRQATSRVPQEVLDRATKFKEYYAKYEALHYQIEALAHPPPEKVNNLLNMRERLLTMKQEFYKKR
ncbi:hypothetical protein V2A60_007673 [Cordyceps javanica]|uniref:COM1 protein n=1 Tax=Cordyceps javanica TaxID=43265 RepID=A0A545W747_9HYPO|nr:COM1 protein [Cordyceps javanica]TQW09817.1 COM1 protein [Cordyceps javanica]